MTGVAVRDGLTLVGVGVDGPGFCGPPPATAGFDVGNGRRLYGRRRCTQAQADLLANAVLYIDASRNGGDGSNEGTAGLALDAAVVFVDGSATKVAAFSGRQLPGELSASCPDAVDLDFTGDFCVAIEADLDWAPSIPCEFMAKPLVDTDDTDDCWAFGVGVDGIPFFELTRDGQTEHEPYGFLVSDGADTDVDYSADTGHKDLILEVDADDGADHAKVMLWEGVPGASPTLVSTITVDGAVTLETSAAALQVGYPVMGGIRRARLYSGRLASPTLLRDFYPDRDWVSGTTMTSAKGEVWSDLLIVESPAFALVTVPDNAALTIGAGANGTVAVWATQREVADVDGEFYRLLNWSTGQMGVDGAGLQVVDVKIAAQSSDFGAALVGDGSHFGFATGTHWTAGTHLWVVTIDRDAATPTMTLYVDGVSHATADITSVGAINPAADLVLGSAAHHAVAKWDTVVDPADIAAALL